MHSRALKHAAQCVVDAARNCLSLAGRKCTAQHAKCCQIRCGCSTIRSILMMIDMNGPDIEAVDEVKALILEPVNAWKNYKERVPSRGSQGARRGMFTLLTLGTCGCGFQ